MPVNRIIQKIKILGIEHQNIRDVLSIRSFASQSGAWGRQIGGLGTTDRGLGDDRSGAYEALADHNVG